MINIFICQVQCSVNIQESDTTFETNLDYLEPSQKPKQKDRFWFLSFVVLKTEYLIYLKVLILSRCGGTHYNSSSLEAEAVVQSTLAWATLWTPDQLRWQDCLKKQ